MKVEGEPILLSVIGQELWESERGEKRREKEEESWPYHTEGNSYAPMIDGTLLQCQEIEVVLRLS